MFVMDSNFTDISVFLSGLDTRLTDFRRLFRDYLSPFVYNRIDDIFESSGDGTWAALDPRYAARKARTHPGKGILRRTDAYFTAATRPNAPGSVLQISPLELVMGVSGLEYAALHEQGGRNLSARPVYGLIVAGDRFEQQVGQLTEKYQREEIAFLQRG